MILIQRLITEVEDNFLKLKAFHYLSLIKELMVISTLNRSYPKNVAITTHNQPPIFVIMVGVLITDNNYEVKEIKRKVFRAMLILLASFKYAHHN